MSVPNQPPSRERVSDWLYEQLRAAILKERLQPGDRLSVPSLASEFRVSRSPAREAVFRLVREGLAQEEPHRGAIVARVDTSRLSSLYDVREVLEGLAARLAAAHRTAADLESIDILLNQHHGILHRDDLSRHVEADLMFHMLVVEAARNEPLRRHHAEIQGQIQLGIRTTTKRSSRGGRELALAEHQEIRRCIDEGDSDGAEAAARRHVRRVRAWLQSSTSEPIADADVSPNEERAS